VTPELLEQEIRVSTIKSDMYYHIPKLKEYSSKSRRVIEFGVRDMNSSWGLLAGNPTWMLSYDFYPPTLEEMLFKFYAVAKDNNISYEFRLSNTLEIVIPHVDFLFIDSLHTYSQLKQELKLHASNVEKFIGFHDTKLFAHVGQQNSDCKFKNSKGLLDAVREFLKENKQWKIDYHTDECNGLTVIKKVSE
jgi:hypothetical protein